jgi:hypothetical protein
MSLIIKNTKTLIDPINFRLNVLLYALPGLGKSLWASTAPNPGIAACETGLGKGLLTIADKGLDYVEPTSIKDFEEIINGKVFADKDTIVLDSLSEMVRTFVKDEALKIPRARGESEKRRAGIPELDDYGTIGEICRRMLRALLTKNPTKHVVVTATEKYDKADPENGQAETLIGPDLPGAMFLGSTAMFDLVLRIRTRPALKDPKDPKSRYSQRYILTQPDGQGSIVKGRPNVNCKPLIPKEVLFVPETGEGCFPWFLSRILEGYSEQLKHSA